MSGKGDTYRPVNRHMYDKGWARMVGQCAKCTHDKEDQCELPADVACKFEEKGSKHESI